MRALGFLLILHTFLVLSVLQSISVLNITQDQLDLKDYLIYRCSKDLSYAFLNNSTNSQIIQYFSDDKELKHKLISGAMLSNHLSRLMVQLSTADVAYNLRFPNPNNKHSLHNSLIQVTKDIGESLQSILAVVNRILASSNRVLEDINTIKTLLTLSLGDESTIFVLESLQNLNQTYYSNADGIKNFSSISEKLENNTRILTLLISNTSVQYHNVFLTTQQRINERFTQGPYSLLVGLQAKEEMAQHSLKQARDNYQAILNRAVKVGLLHVTDTDTEAALRQYLNAEKTHIEALARINEMHRNTSSLIRLPHDFDKIYAQWAQDSENLLTTAVSGLHNTSESWRSLSQFLQPLADQVTLVYELIKKYFTIVSTTPDSPRTVIGWKQRNVLSLEMIEDLKKEMLFVYFLSNIYFDVLTELVMCQLVSNSHLLLLSTEEDRQAYLIRLDIDFVLIAKRAAEIFDKYHEKLKVIFHSFLLDKSKYPHCLFLLEDLANEILYEIFEYLDMYHIYKGFFNLNKRFQNLIINSNFLHKINISKISKHDFKGYYKNILLPNRHRIRLLRLSNSCITEIIFSAPRITLQFVRLESLIPNNIQMKYWNKIFNYLIHLSELHSLAISIGDYIQLLSFIFLNVLNYLKLKYFKIEYEIKSYKSPLSIHLSKYESCPIQYLIINSRFPFKSLNNLLCYLPELRHLSINSLVHYQDYFEENEFSPMKLKYLKYVSPKFDCIRFNKVEKILKEFLYYVQILRLTTRYDKAYLNAKRWEELIVSYMPYLRIFDINYVLDKNSTYHHSMNQFNSSFRIEKNWFFTHQHDWKKVQMMECFIQQIHIDEKTMDFIGK
ncbi:unnamed protein product [Rotaria magnacalcarata]|uniref:F-box domain-containing protein n=2 Tax=Rotaria magnacalcarata TaxID=392030 RepID=A0A820EZH8_9BILA|nr:unnamed protein product [Rotaria magnacalcarata]